MRLKRLHIRTLPGIEPGFTFEPPDAGINIVTGPNAIGKSSLARALGYLLHTQKNDPVALSLEAEFEGDETAWRVVRNGSQIIWHRDGRSTSPPALPGAGQTGLYRLSMESLLDSDDQDRDLARELRNSLRGGFDLDALRTELGARFAQNDQKNLRNAEKALRQAEAEYDALERQEREELPRLERELKAAQEAQERLKRLQHGLDLHKAIQAKKSCEEQLNAYPPDMDRLRGGERDDLAKLEQREKSLLEKLRDQQRQLRAAEAVLEQTGLQDSGPDPEDMDAMESRLQSLGQKLARRNNARVAREQAAAGLKQALEPFNNDGKPPRLDEEDIKQAEEIAVPLIKEQHKRETLQLKLDQAGQPPDETEINKLYEAGSALREWLAASAGESQVQPESPNRWLRGAFWGALTASGIAAVLALVQQAWPAVLALMEQGWPVALTVGLVALSIALWGLMQRQRPVAGSTAGNAKQRFIRTGLNEPPEWTAAIVEEYLRAEIDKRHSALVLQREHAAQAGGLRAELDKVESDITRLHASKQEAAARLGFDPALPSISPDIFLQYCRQLLEAQSRHAQATAELAEVERDIADDIGSVRDFLAPWVSTDEDIHRLQASFRNLKRRFDDAQGARKDITHNKHEIQSSEDAIKQSRADIEAVFTQCKLEPGAHIELYQRLEGLEQWKEKRKDLYDAENEEKRIRSLLLSHADIIRNVDEDKLAALETEFAKAAEQADKHTELLRQQTEITTRLADAGKEHKLSQARASLDSARATLQDKREQAWLYETTELLLNDVEQAFHSENEPEILSRARKLFRNITANAFDLQLDKDDTFFARDLKQEAPRQVSELSSGTRMQLLLALRMAWLEAQEQGGETLPLFLDEALTTSDEERFAEMVKSLERLAYAQERQIFYLSARRHERALWKQATGNELPTIDLADVRFPRQARASHEYDISPPSSLPSPEGQTPEDYASALGVPPFNPHLEPGATHLFYLLRDNLDLLCQLMENWRIASLGQLEGLLNSDAVSAAIADSELQSRLRHRLKTVRAWITLWSRGRGRPVNRIALEQSGIVSETFMDRLSDLAGTVNEEGKTLVEALRAGKVSRFQSSKIEELERWLADEGYIEQEPVLSADERRRLTLQQVMSVPNADVEDANRVITWLESASP